MPASGTIAEAKDTFYNDLRGSPVQPGLVINCEQTFHLYNPTRGFTWEKRGSPRVQLLEGKDGFTLVPVVSAAGVVGADR